MKIIYEFVFHLMIFFILLLVVPRPFDNLLFVAIMLHLIYVIYKKEKKDLDIKVKEK